MLYLHGVPTSSDDWVAFLERTGGLAPDLPGFGRTGKRGDGDFTMPGYDRFVEAFLDHAESSACAWSCTTGAPSACCGPSASPSASSAWS